MSIHLNGWNVCVGVRILSILSSHHTLWHIRRLSHVERGLSTFTLTKCSPYIFFLHFYYYFPVLLLLLWLLLLLTISLIIIIVTCKRVIFFCRKRVPCAHCVRSIPFNKNVRVILYSMERIVHAALHSHNIKSLVGRKKRKICSVKVLGR